MAVTPNAAIVIDAARPMHARLIIPIAAARIVIVIARGAMRAPITPRVTATTANFPKPLRIVPQSTVPRRSNASAINSIATAVAAIAAAPMRHAALNAAIPNAPNPMISMPAPNTAAAVPISNNAPPSATNAV